MNEQKDVSSDWYRKFFERDYLRVYKDFFPIERTTQEVEGILDILNLEKGASILDLCCGQGRHSIELAKRGFQVTGLDLSEIHIQEARQASEAQILDIKWLRKDMRDIPEEFAGNFDAIINMFSAFGYLESQEEDIKVLKAVRRSLKPDGQFLMEIMNREFVIRHFKPKDWYYTSDGLLILEERRFDLQTGQNQVQVQIIEEDGKKTVQGHAMTLYSLSEMKILYGAAELEIREVFGALDKRPYDFDCHRMVILAGRT
ncbi:MAG: SAM-dependent methyltransferase [Candidatus Thorarchaeota archaeon]